MGALKKHKLEGGRRGHSNMNHWMTAAEIKVATRRARRRDDKRVVKEHIRESEERRPERTGERPVRE